jgi:hypothetical protein
MRQTFATTYQTRRTFVGAGLRFAATASAALLAGQTPDPFQNHGPVYNFGRIAFRQMYKTRMRYRNLVVHTRNELA